MSRRNRTLEIETPEGVTFSLLLAGPFIRFVAWAVDAAAILAASQLILQPLSAAAVISPDVASAAHVFLYFVISIGYGIVPEWRWRGQTLGKRLLRLRVMDEQGLHLRFSQVAIRNLMRAIDTLPALYLVGGVSCMITANARRLGDIAANTIVVRHAALPYSDLARIFEGKFNSLLACDHLARQLRRCAPPELVSLAVQALVRRDQFEPDARVKVFGDIAARFRSLVEFPEEATAQLTDEQYVRDAVAVVCGQPGRRS